MRRDMSPEYAGFTHCICVVSRIPNSRSNLNILSSCYNCFAKRSVNQYHKNSGSDADLFNTLNRSRTILSVLVHVCAFASVVIACAYTFRALAFVPFSVGALLGAIFYLVLLLIVWD